MLKFTYADTNWRNFMNLYAEAINRLPPDQISHFRSDLCLRMSYDSMALVSAYRKQGGFVDEVQDANTQLYWYYIPWGYTPYWQRHYRFITENFAWEFIDRNCHSPYLRDWSNQNLKRTFSAMKCPPHENLYPAIRGALCSIFSAYSNSGEADSSMIPA